MSNISAIFIIIGALWASVSAKANMFTVVNQRRDAVLTGRLDRAYLSVAHRRLILERDWKPIGWGIVGISGLFSFVVIFIPYLISPVEGVKIITALCFVIAVYNALAGFATARHLLAEQSYMDAVLRELEQAAVPDASASESKPTHPNSSD